MKQSSQKSKVKSQKSKVKGQRSKVNKYLCLFVFIFGLTAFGLIYSNVNSQKVSAEEKQNEIETAMFTRQEFFGAAAIVPFPTAQARENLAKLLEKSPDNALIIGKLAELDEKLGQIDFSEKEFLRVVEFDSKQIPIPTE